MCLGLTAFIMAVYYHPRRATSRELSPQMGIIRQITPKYKKIKKLKFIGKVKQSIYIGVFKGAELKNGKLFCAQTTPSLCFGLIFV